MAENCLALKAKPRLHVAASSRTTDNPLFSMHIEQKDATIPFHRRMQFGIERTAASTPCGIPEFLRRRITNELPASARFARQLLLCRPDLHLRAGFCPLLVFAIHFIFVLLRQ
jgi:hypothetical protein